MDVISNLINEIIEGGPNAIIALLLILWIATAIGFKLTYNSLKDKERQLEKKTERNEKLLENYYEASEKVTEALNSVQIALIEIKSKM